MSINENQDYNGSQFAENSYPPKPALLDKKDNAFIRSLLSLLIYALLFYFLINDNIVNIAALLLVIIIHEMGHFIFMRQFNYSNVKIFIVPLLGAFTTGKKQQVSQWQLCFVILAGPVPGIIIGCILFWMNLNLQNETIKMLYQIFLAINLLNCLPFYPLDGGRLIETLFFKENHTIRLVFGILSIMALLVLFIFAFSPLLLIIPVLIGLELYNEHKHQKIRDYLRQEKINYNIDYNSLPNKDYWLIRDCLILSFPKKYGGVSVGRYEYALAEPLFVQHINSVLQTNLSADIGVGGKVGFILFYLILFIVPMVLFALHSL